MTPKYLDSTLSAELDSVHQKYAPNSQLWVGEAAAAWHSGADGVTNAFTSSFWWSDALGVLAAHNHSVYCRQTLLGGNYGLLNRLTYQPNPDFYISQLFHELMGDVVLKVTGAAANGHGYLRTYTQCNRGGNGVTLLLINIAPNTTFVFPGGNGNVSWTPRLEYVLTAEQLSSKTINLNGQPLVVGSSGSALPPLLPKKVPSSGSSSSSAEDGTFSLSPHSIAFVVLPDAAASVCTKR